MNRGLTVYCNVKMLRLNSSITAEFTKKISSIPEVAECYNISGSFDFLMKIYAPDMEHYRRFVLEELGSLENLGSIESVFVMDEVKQCHGISF